MTTVTAPTAQKCELSVEDGILTTSPASIVISSRETAELDGRALRFRRKGRGIAVVDAESGIVIAWSHPHHAHEHALEHRNHQWELHVRRSWWGSSQRFRRGRMRCPELGLASIDSTYVHYVSEWRAHRRLHRAWTTGFVNIEGEVPGPILALALRLTLGTDWLELRTGDWVETRREWDFAGF